MTPIPSRQDLQPPPHAATPIPSRQDLQRLFDKMGRYVEADLPLPTHEPTIEEMLPLFELAGYTYFKETDSYRAALTWTRPGMTYKSYVAEWDIAATADHSMYNKRAGIKSITAAQHRENIRELFQLVLGKLASATQGDTP